MPGSVRRLALGIVLAVVSVSAAVVGSEPAHADLVTSGQVTFSGEQANGLMLGDHAYSYSTSQGFGIDASLRTDWPLDPLVVYSRDSSDYWDVEFAAPPGQQLTVGTYTGAVREGFQDVGQPGLDFTKGDGGCNTVTGSFTIDQLVLGAQGTLGVAVQSLSASFELHCGYQTGAIRGRVLINVAGPPMLAVNLGVSATGTVAAPRGTRGQRQSLVSVNGTTTCTQTAKLNLTGTIQQTGTTPMPPLTGAVACAPGSTVGWTASAWAPPTKPGAATVAVTVAALDPFYLIPASATLTAPVQFGEAPVRIYPRVDAATDPQQGSAPAQPAGAGSQAGEAGRPVAVRHDRLVRFI